MLDTIDIDLTGKRVLDAGCNRGGFLRLLVDGTGIAEGYGYDPASGAVTDARHLTSGRPLVFEIADTVPEGWSDFDVAFSHEVLYLLEDLTAHAASLFDAMRPGGAYFAVMGVHEGSPDDVGVARGKRSRTRTAAAADRNLTYCNSQQLDLYIPRTAPTRPLPIALYVHGGGLTAGDKADLNPTFLDALAKAGYAVVSVNYRLAPRRTSLPRSKTSSAPSGICGPRRVTTV